MNNKVYYLLCLIICSAITAFLRLGPFLLFNDKELPPRLVAVGEKLPVAILVLLVIYAYRNLPGQDFGWQLAGILAGITTVGVHLWRKSTFLTIVVGTGLYMLIGRIF